MTGSEATFRELLAAGADPNQTTTYAGVSLLALAQIHGNGGAEGALREYGAAMSAKSWTCSPMIRAPSCARSGTG